MKNKSIFCYIALILFALTANSQTSIDTIYLKDNTSYIGKVVGKEWKNYQFVIAGTQKVIDIPEKDVTRLIQGNENFQWEKIDSSVLTEYSRFDTLHFDDLRAEVKQIKIQTIVTSTYVEKAGKLGVAGGILSIGGTILSVVGAFSGKSALTYVGAGLAGTGLILDLAAFGNLMNAGNLTRKKITKL